MAIDLKYGYVAVEHKGPDEDEPVIVFRAQDSEVPKLLNEYHDLCEAAGSPEHHLAAIMESKVRIERWQQEHPDRVRVPNSNRWKERTGGIQSS